MVDRVKVPGQVKDDRTCVPCFRILFDFQNGIFCTSSRAVAKTPIRKQGLINRHQLLGNCLLDDAVNNRRNTKLPYSAVRLRDLDTSDRLWSVMSAPYSVNQLVAMFLQPRKRLFNGHPINTRCSLVCLHPLIGPVQIILCQYPSENVRLCTVPFLPYPIERAVRSHISFVSRTVLL